MIIINIIVVIFSDTALIFYTREYLIVLVSMQLKFFSYMMA